MDPYVSSQVVYWDRVAPSKQFSHPVRLSWIENYLQLPANERRILDYGCGYGRTLDDLSQAGYRNLVGMDFSAGMLSQCRNRSCAKQLIQSDGRSLPLQSASVDLVILFAVLTCIPDSSEQRRQISEVNRVLRPGGILYISDLLINDDERNRSRYDEFAPRFGCYGVFELPEGVVVRHHEKEWIGELTESFTQLEFERFEVLTMNGNKSAAFQYLGRKQ